MSLLLLFGSTSAPGPIVGVNPEPADHAFFAWNNLIDGSILSGGNWRTALPLANLKNRTLVRVARSVDASPASTWFDIDVGTFKQWRGFAVQDHNLTLAARYRLRTSYDAAHTLTDYDSGWLDVWPPVYDDLEWGAVNFWERTYSEDERRGYIWTLIGRLPHSTDARYIRFEFDDPLNPASFVQVGRVFIGGSSWVPSSGISTGAGLGWEDDSRIEQADGGAEFFDERPRYRSSQLQFNNLGNDEAYGKAFEMMRQAGRTREVLFMWNPSDTKHAIRRQFICRLRQLSRIEHPYPVIDSVAFEIKEIQR